MTKEKEIEEITEFLENADFKPTTWMKNTVIYNKLDDTFTVDLNFEFEPEGCYSFESAKKMMLDSKK